MNRKIITIVAFFAVSLGLFLTLIYPKYENWQNLRLRTKEKNTEFQTKTEYFNEIKETTIILDTYPEALAKISSALPTDPALPLLTNFLQTSASATGMSLDKISIDSADQASGQKKFKETVLTLEVSGSYSAFKNFLSGLEKSSRIINVSSLSFKTPQKDKDPFVFSLSIKAFSY
jgi:Tfp pilus assembly protein PilO